MLNEIMNEIRSGRNVFITGSAGTGKSYTLKQLMQGLPGIDVTASTGIAALNVGGTTIHRWSGIRLGKDKAQKIVDEMYWPTKNRILSCDILAIDEISMLSGEIFDLLDDVFQLVRDNDRPFGGIQIIAIGDFLQLPPVTRRGDERTFAFQSEAWAYANFANIILRKCYRQDETEFLNVLNDIRRGESVPEDFFALGSYDPDAVHLFALNKLSDAFNANELKKIDSKAVEFKAIDTAVNDNFRDALHRDCLTPRYLVVKESCRVILLKNIDIDRGLVNGMTGTVNSILPHAVVVDFDNGETQSLSKMMVGEIKVKDNIKAQREQIPLRLAYSISIHKSQGMTLERANIDMKGVFESGQSYVALSRVKTLAGLYVKNFSNKKIKVDEEVLKFMKEIDA